MEVGTIIWTTGTIAVFNENPEVKFFLPVLTKGRFDGFTDDGLAHVWFGDRIGHLDIPTKKISESYGR